MVDFATIVSFLTGPILGYLNLRAVTGPNVAHEHRPGRGLILLSWAGLVLLGGTAVIYLASLWPQARLTAFCRPLGLILKIETRRAFEHLPALLLAAMRKVMLAKLWSHPCRDKGEISFRRHGYHFA